MWHGQPGLIKTAVHQIELIPKDVLPINSEQYRAGSKAHQFEEAKIEYMLQMGLI